MKGSQRRQTLSAISDIMEHIGVDEYTIGPQKRNLVLKYNKKKSRSLCTTYIENNSHFLTQSSSRKWCECILKILRLAKKNGTEGEKREDKTVHHFDVIKAACDAGLKYSDPKSDGEAAPISSTALYNIRQVVSKTAGIPSNPQII